MAYPVQHTDPNAAGYTPYADVDNAEVERRLREMAQQSGVSYDPSDAEDVYRKYYNSGPNGGEGGDLEAALRMAQDKYAGRAQYDGISVGDRDASEGTGAPGSVRNTPAQQSLQSQGTGRTSGQTLTTGRWDPTTGQYFDFGMRPPGGGTSDLFAQIARILAQRQQTGTTPQTLDALFAPLIAKYRQQANGNY